jgi:RimJ/RimL family protein N-acetyltransferase
MQSGLPNPVRTVHVVNEVKDPRAPRRRKRKTTKISVRRIRGPDWNTFRDLRLAALRSDPLAFGSTFARESAYTQEKWKAWCRDGATGHRNATFVAVGPSKEPIGIVGVFLANGEPHVWGMWTRPKWRNRGVGRHVMERLLAWLDRYHPVRDVVLEVNPTQEAAVAVYSAMGFRFNGVEEPLGHDPPAVVHQMIRVRRPRTPREPRHA